MMIGIGTSDVETKSINDIEDMYMVKVENKFPFCINYAKAKQSIKIVVVFVRVAAIVMLSRSSAPKYSLCFLAASI